MVDTRQPAGPATRLVIVFVAALAAATATAGTWAGTVRNAEGEPMHGVMVRFTHDGTGVSESVFTDANGGFEWTGQRNGTLRLRLRTPYYRDLELAVDEGTADGQACTSNNPVPATALEGGVLQVICIDVQPAQEA